MKDVVRHIAGSRQNQLLASLPQAEWNRLQPQLEMVNLSVGQVMCKWGDAPAHVYFPTTAIVSLMCTTRDGNTSEIAVVGNEGVVEISLFMGGDATSSRAVVQSAGQAYRLPARALKQEFNRGGPMLTTLLRYTQTLIAQVSQTAACNRHHSVEQQLSRRLLMALDRLHSSELVMTQEQLGSLLGVRRESVTSAALKLQQDGVIRYARGRITVLDRPLLERRSCECYVAVKKECDRLLPMAAAA